VRYLLQVEVVSAEEVVRKNFVFDVFPPAGFVFFRKEEYTDRIGVYDPEKLFERILEKEELPFTRLKSLQALNTFQGEIILAGIDILEDKRNPAFAIISSQVSQGTKVLLMSEQPLTSNIHEELDFPEEIVRLFSYIIPDASREMDFIFKIDGRQDWKYYGNPFTGEIFASGEQEGGEKTSLALMTCGKGWFAFVSKSITGEYETDPVMSHIFKHILHLLVGL
jgi:hypothetical protein